MKTMCTACRGWRAPASAMSIWSGSSTVLGRWRRYISFCKSSDWCWSMFCCSAVYIYEVLSVLHHSENEMSVMFIFCFHLCSVNKHSLLFALYLYPAHGQWWGLSFGDPVLCSLRSGEEIPRHGITQHVQQVNCACLKLKESTNANL